MTAQAPANPVPSIHISPICYPPHPPPLQMLPAFRCPLENKESQQLTLEQTGPSRRLARPAYQYLCSRAKVESSGHGQVHAALGGGWLQESGNQATSSPGPGPQASWKQLLYCSESTGCLLASRHAQSPSSPALCPPLLTDLPSALCGKFQNQESVTKLRHREKHHRCGLFNLTWTSAQLSRSLGVGSLHSGQRL